MEKQIQTLTSELNHLKNNQNNVTTFATKNNSQEQSQTTSSLLSMPSPRKLQRFQRNETTSSLTPKNRANTSVQNRGMASEDLNNMVQPIQNVMQALTTFGKKFIAHKDTKTTH